MMLMRSLLACSILAASALVFATPSAASHRAHVRTHCKVVKVFTPRRWLRIEPVRVRPIFRWTHTRRIRAR